MKVEEFCELIKDKLSEKTAILPETNFKDLESYSSLSSVFILQLIEEKLNVQLNPRSFRKIQTIDDIVEAVGREKFN